MGTDTRIPYGMRCTWWDSIDKVALTPPGPSGHQLPCCPVCGGMLYEAQSEAEWLEGVDRHEAKGHPGYRAMVEWSRGKCFPNFAATAAAYAGERSGAVEITEHLGSSPELFAFVRDRFELGTRLGVFESLRGGPNGDEQCASISRDGVFVAFATFYFPYDDVQFVWIDQLWVEPAHRRMGLARELIAAIREQAGADRIALGTLAANSTMHAVVAKLGFAHHSTQYMLEGGA